MNTKRVFYIMIGSLALLFCLLIGSVVAGNLVLQKQSKKLWDIKLESQLIDAQQVSVSKANKDIQKYAELESVANTIVPQDKDQARTVREIINLAQENGIPISSITFPSSNLGSSSTPSKTSTSGGSTSTATNSSSTSSSSSSSSSTTPSVTQVTPVTDIKGVSQMLITIQSSATQPIPYSSLIAFLKALENNRHTAQVSTMNILPYTKDISRLTFTIGINVYVRL